MIDWEKKFEQCYDLSEEESYKQLSITMIAYIGYTQGINEALNKGVVEK